MKIEFDLPDEYSDKMLVICEKKNPNPIAYLNVYEKGDVWLKLNSCFDCLEEHRQKCCKDCPMYTPQGCFLHLWPFPACSNKPYRCVVYPPPDKTISKCALQFECIYGKNKGKIKKVREPEFLEKNDI